MGKERNIIMYDYIRDKEFLSKMKTCCADITNQLVQRINKEGLLKVEAHLVGSGAKKLITQNSQEPVDLDYNLVLLQYKLRIDKIKEYVMELLDEVLADNGLPDCHSHDSTSVISTDYIYFLDGNQTRFKIDIAIVKKNRYGWHRLIHEKTGIVQCDKWMWNLAPDSKGLEDRVKWIKDNHLWEDVIDKYLEKKNMYLRRWDRENHPSFNVYIETINEIYDTYR